MVLWASSTEIQLSAMDSTDMDTMARPMMARMFSLPWYFLFLVSNMSLKISMKLRESGREPSILQYSLNSRRSSTSSTSILLSMCWAAW